jgi:dsDNA-specific endonuclease/ATPase MutS2
VSRAAEEILEFDRLRDLLRRRTTCVPGRQTIDGLSFSQDRSALEAAFVLIGEAIEFLRDGSELGFGSLPDPSNWLAELEAPVAVLTPLMMIDAAALADTTAMLRDAFRGAAGEPSRGGPRPTAQQNPYI